MPEDFLTNNTGSTVGFILAAVLGALFFLKKLSGMLKLEGNNIKATVDSTQRLLDLLDAERRDKAVLQSLLSEANSRADKANEERNSMVRELGEIKAQLVSLQIEVRMLRDEANSKQD